MGLLTGSATGPTIFNNDSPLLKTRGLLGNVDPPVANPMLNWSPPSSTRCPPGSAASPGGGCIPMAGSAPQPEPVPSQPDISGLLQALEQYLAPQMENNLLQQMRNPNGVPFQSQVARPNTLSDFYGIHGISPTQTFGTAASPINYMGLFGASDPYWGSNAMPNQFPLTPSPMAQMESLLADSPYAQYAFEPYMDRIRGGSTTPEDTGGGTVSEIEKAIMRALTYPAQYNNTRPPSEQVYDPDLYAGG